jgi:hypothetical protein
MVRSDERRVGVFLLILLCLTGVVLRAGQGQPPDARIRGNQSAHLPERQAGRLQVPGQSAVILDKGDVRISDRLGGIGVVPGLGYLGVDLRLAENRYLRVVVCSPGDLVFTQTLWRCSDESYASSRFVQTGKNIEVLEGMVPAPGTYILLWYLPAATRRPEDPEQSEWSTSFKVSK